MLLGIEHFRERSHPLIEFRDMYVKEVNYLIGHETTLIIGRHLLGSQG
jgi:hypothetical protein